MSIRNWSLTFSHVAVTSYGTSSARCGHGASGRQADDTHSGFQFSLTLQFQESDIVIQRLAVVVVMNVSGGHA